MDDLIPELERELRKVVDMVAHKHKNIKEINWLEAVDEAFASVREEFSMRLDELEEEQALAEDEEDE